MNKVFLVGNLTRDPELSETSSGVAVCKFSIAVNRPFASADGNRETDFFNITVWRGKGENCAKYLKKGKKVGIVGSLQNRSYEDKDGVKRYVTDIIAEEVEFLSSSGDQDASNNSENETVVASTRRERPQLEAIDDNQLPF